MEIFDFLSVVWILGVFFRSRRADTRVLTFLKSRTGLVCLGLIFTGVLGTFWQPEIWKDWEHYHLSPYFFFRSGELEPFFPFRTVFSTFVSVILFLCIGVTEKKPALRIGNTVIAGVTTGFAISIVLGIGEFLSPKISLILDFYHIWLGGYVDRDLSHRVLPLVPDFQSRSIQSLFWNRSWFGMYLVACSPFVFLAIRSFVKKGSSNLRKFFLVLFPIPVFFAIFVLVGARGPFFSLFVGGLLFSVLQFFAHRKRFPFGTEFALFTVVTAISLSVLFPLVFAKTEFFPGLGEERKELFSAGLLLLQESPVFGWGMESYGWANEQVLKEEGEGTRLHSTHNQILQIAVGTGLSGLFLYLFLWGGALYRGIRFATKKRGGAHRILVSAALGIFVYSWFQEWFFLRSTQILFWILLLSLNGKRRGGAIGPKIYVPIILCLTVLGLPFFGQPLSRFGTFFPPDRISESYILEGEGSMKIGSPGRIFLGGDLGFRQEGADRKRIFRYTIQEKKTAVLELEPGETREIVLSVGILRWDCSIDSMSATSAPYFRKTDLLGPALDPEPRKLCLRFSRKDSL
ncbi:O-antigen ligase family protein [Leptospira fletcheri]|nr:O-antigen ligase family protein [Leptospira fletcheri]